MHVVCACDDGFVHHAAACLISAAENGGDDLHLWLIDDHISAANAAALDACMARYPAAFQRIPAATALTAELSGHGHVSKATYWRLCIPELLDPSIDRVLYIDVDTLVLDDLAPLADHDFAGAWTAAVHDPGYDGKYLPHKLNLGLPADAPCFNAGVLLINLAAWRAESVGQRARTFIADNRDTTIMMDQDGLNVINHGHWQQLSPRWNMMHRFYQKPHRAIYGCSRSDWSTMLDHPGIVHFSSCNKPDHLLGRHPLGQRYWDYRAKSPWPERRLKGDTFGNRFRLLVNGTKALLRPSIRS